MPSKDVRLLALDGAGVRGLSALMILEQLMQAVNSDAPPKPCEYFDMIGGTKYWRVICRSGEMNDVILTDQADHDHARPTEDEH